MDSFLRTVKPHVKLRIQVLYVLLSGGVLWWLLDFVYQKHGQMWFAHAGASIVLLAFLSLLFFWLVPRSALIRLAHGDPKTKQRPASRIVKLGLALNFLTGLLLLQLAIGTWPMRAMVLIGLFIVSWLAFIILHSYLFPVWSWMAELFAPPAPPAYDPDARQGRNVRME